MSSIIQILLLAAGFALLIKGADFLVGGSANLARSLGVSEIVVGLTIVAFGTSSPELIVNTFASLNGRHELILGNVIGSNIFNTLLVLGVSALIYPISVGRSTAWREIPFALLATAAIGVLLHDGLFFGAPADRLSRLDAVVLLVMFCLFLFYLARIIRRGNDSPVPSKPPPGGRVRFVVLIVIGLIGLVVGGRLTVSSATVLATAAGISEKVIAVAVVSVGTSLPELMTSVVAAFRKENDIAVGNIVGSNIFNVLLVLGVSAAIAPVEVSPFRFGPDTLLLIATALLLFFTMFTGTRKRLDRWEAAVFVVLYGLYLAFILST